MQSRPLWFPVRLALLVLLLLAAAMVVAQIDGDRGVPPINSSGDFAVSGVEVNVTGNNAADARQKGWQEAQRKAWTVLSGRSAQGPSTLSDETLNGMVSAIIVEHEQIGPRRYVARLGVLFDRARAGEILGIGGTRRRSAPMLVVPVMWSGGSAQVFENRTPWQRAWARYRTSESAIDYVRTSGAGSDGLLINAGQTGRRGRIWWRLILDQYGAADVVMPMVRLERQWPGGPIVGQFTARHGPDNRLLGGFTLRAGSSEGLDAMLDQGIERLDRIYTQALARGELRPDATLIIEDPLAEDELEELDEELGDDVVDIDEGVLPGQAITIQLLTPDAAALTAGERALRAIPGVTGATTTSLALGGTSVIEVGYSGDIAVLRGALEARGWQVQQGDNVLRIRRASAAPEGE